MEKYSPLSDSQRNILYFNIFSVSFFCDINLLYTYFCNWDVGTFQYFDNILI